MARRAEQRRRRAIAVAVSLAAHLMIPLAFLSAQPEPAFEVLEDPPITVSLAAPPPPPPAPAPPPGPAKDDDAAPAPPAPPKPTPARPALRVRPAPPTPTMAPLVAPLAETPAPVALVTLGDAELAGARTAGAGAGQGAGAGGGGQPCDMVRRLQAALRRDPEVRAAVASANVAGGRAILVWDGDWLRSPGQEGKGLAGVRQAIVMEVAFAPEHCRDDPVQGLVLLSLGDQAGAGRVVLGGGAWRWTDLLGARRRGG
jgi:hypothetical protein